jgi:hypothetical protein
MERGISVTLTMINLTRRNRETFRLIQGAR